jgi:benzoate-CoA ligase
MPAAIYPSHLSFQPAQKMPIIQASSRFIWGIQAKVSGIYVSPFEVEGVLATHPDVLEAAVVAWPDPEGLIKPKAFVVLKAPEKAGDPMSRALQDHVKAKLAPYKYPRWIEFRRDLPKTATGKIQRIKLRAEGAPR